MGDFDAWEPDEPPREFAEKVVAAAARERKARTSRALRTGTVVLVAGAAAAIALVVTPFGPRGGAASGEAAAKERTEVAMGSRAIAVLEPGAHVTWSGDEVVQSGGDVFYRVETRATGAPFRVHTAAGDVTVLGTCFRVSVKGVDDMNRRDMAMGVAGAAMGALALVGVYEGHVAVSHAKDTVDLRAGQSAQLDARGAHATGDLASGEKAFAEAAAGKSATADDDALLAANQNLADQVKAYKEQLEANDQAKKALEARLKSAEDKLATQENDGAPPKSPYDVSPDEWKDMAENGELRARYPCAPSSDKPWTASAETLQSLGISPDDGAAVAAAYQRSVQRSNDLTMSGCAQVLGSADLAARLGTGVCGAVISNSVKGDAQRADMKNVALIRAGELPMPSPKDPSVDPYERMLLDQTGALKSFEGDLAQTLGPDEAHRIAYSDELGACSSSMTNRSTPKLPPR
jgi:ferric-dicitrate binding protein FerR (iron transport regulator)